MILKASKRGGAMQMAKHLLNAEQNEHVNVYEISGFMADDISGALNEIYAISKGTKCTRFMFSISLSPPQTEKVPISAFEDALTSVEKKLNMEGQPRIVVFHEKEGRRHAHAVYSRIDVESMTAIDLPYFKNKLKDISKRLYLDHGWQLPKGFIDKNNRNPLNYTRSEWQQAARTGQNPKAIKAILQECWAVSDNKKSFESSLQENGYYLAKGDKRGYVVIDMHGEVYSLTRQLGQKKKALEERLGKAENLPSVSETKTAISSKLSTLFKRYTNELNAQHQKKMLPLLRAKQTMTNEHRALREQLDIFQKARWQKEEIHRSQRIRTGFKGIWDKLNGKYWKLRRLNEKEAYRAYIRDQQQREELINKQLTERQNLQAKMNLLRNNHEQERISLIRDLSNITVTSKDKIHDQSLSKKELSKEQRTKNITPNYRDSQTMEDKDIDMEPEI